MELASPGIQAETDSPIFIVGTPRSGTTLTAKILGRHSLMFIPGETHFMEDIYARRKELGKPPDHAAMDVIIDRLETLYTRFNEPADQLRVNHLMESRNEFRNAFNICKNYADIFSQFMILQMHYEKKTRWGNHTPRDIFNIQDIISFFPSARIIICIRDVRDFLLSYQGMRNVATCQAQTERISHLYHPVVTSLLWKATMRKINLVQELVPKENWQIVKYEELVQTPQTIVPAICQTVGLNFETQMLDVESNNSSEVTYRRKKGGIFSESVGRWRTKLAAEDVYIAQKVARKELVKFGYALEQPSVNPAKIIQLLHSAPLAFYRGLAANSQIRGPLLPYLMRRLSSFR
jgi:hypothetical protein